MLFEQLVSTRIDPKGAADTCEALYLHVIVVLLLLTLPSQWVPNMFVALTLRAIHINKMIDQVDVDTFRRILFDQHNTTADSKTVPIFNWFKTNATLFRLNYKYINSAATIERPQHYQLANIDGPTMESVIRHYINH